MVTSAVLKLSSVESGSLHVIQQINAFTRTLWTTRIYNTHIQTRLLGLGEALLVVTDTKESGIGNSE